MRITLYSLLYIFVILLGKLSDIAPGFISTPLRNFELTLRERIYWCGPGGFDDAISQDLEKKPEIYSEAYIKRLYNSKPGTEQELNALHHLILFLDIPTIHERVERYAHTKASTNAKEKALRILEQSKKW
ncbi:hypothetical protein [Halothiobacillus diazotrophicus]|uniref:hypothetical protein n=1 Tax=Halothiobacillus diazotrophicus TaxID=1860122 RepID=UPI0012E7D82F|nr:hypothetical protein [Halothiobacillus diazotrophicus]